MLDSEEVVVDVVLTLAEWVLVQEGGEELITLLEEMGGNLEAEEEDLMSPLEEMGALAQVVAPEIPMGQAAYLVEIVALVTLWQVGGVVLGLEVLFLFKMMGN